ncbi:hypothetical protein AMJ86_00790 [bacterium SM23_57]|nr:MAG: hypothetical protein AMJ86_00790 [bacterium SM23_57]
MPRIKGTFDFAANLEGLIAGPIDARMKVALRSDLIDSATWEKVGGLSYLYNGMIVAVGDDPTPEYNGIYILLDALNYTNIISWQRMTSGVTAANELKGGLHSFNTMAEMYAIPSALRYYGMLVWIRDEGRFYQLIGGLADINFVEWIISAGREEVSRTIYVATTGNDTTGDGSVGNPFLTIFRALQDLQPTIYGCTITISLGTGTFDFTTACRTKIDRFNFVNNALLNFEGQMGLWESGFTAVAATQDGEYTLTKAARTFTKNELTGKFHSNGSNYDPIIYNTAGSDSCTMFTIREGRNYTTIYENQTTLNNSDNDSTWLVFRPLNADGEIGFYNFWLTPNVKQFHNPSRLAQTFRRCVYRFINVTTATNLEMNGQDDDGNKRTKVCTFIESLVMCTGNSGQWALVNANESGLNTLRWNRSGIFTNQNALKLQKSIGFRTNRFAMASDAGAGSGLTFTYFGTIEVTDFFSLIDFTGMIQYTVGSVFRGLDYSNLQCYKFPSYSGSKVFIADISVGTSDAGFYLFVNEFYKNTDSLPYFSNLTLTRFIKPGRAFWIAIPGTYPEFENTLVEPSILNNAVTYINIGDLTYTRAIKIHYALARPVGRYEQGELSILSTGTSLFITQTFQNAGTAVGVAFSVQYSGNTIQLVATSDNSGSTTVMRYNVNRIMRYS